MPISMRRATPRPTRIDTILIDEKFPDFFEDFLADFFFAILN